MPHDFVGQDRTEHFPNAEVGPDGLPTDWDEHRLYRCRVCGREGWGLMSSYLDERGRREEYEDLPVPGESPNEGLSPACTPEEVAVWDVLGS